MTDTKALSDLLRRLKTSAAVPSASEWLILKEQLCTDLEAQLQDHDVLHQTLDLSYQEMQKMLELFDQRDLLTKSIFNASHDIIITLDESGQVIEFNQALGVLLKIDEKAVMGQKLVTVIPDCAFKTDLMQLFSSEKPLMENSILERPYESNLFDSAGNKLEVLVSINRIQLRESVVYQLYIKDLSNEKAAAQQLEESRSQLMLTSKMSALGEMAGGVAHEINTPLAVIQMRCDLLLECVSDSSLDQQVLVRSLTVIDETVKRIAKIVSGLKSFARDGRKDPMILSPISKIIEDTFCLCKERFLTRDVRLEYLAKADIEIKCRPVEISQVLLNLLNNAFDAVQLLPDKWVKVELEITESLVSLRITDSGNGISPDIQKKLMQPFFTTKEIGKGTGLGLSISKGIIESHGGTLTLVSAAVNTSFVISLPRQ